MSLSGPRRRNPVVLAALVTAALVGSMTAGAVGANAAGPPAPAAPSHPAPPPKPTPPPKPPKTTEVQILGLNDFHGAIEPPTGSAGRLGPSGTPEFGGSEYLATHVRNLRATNPNTLFVSAGDLIGATPLTSALFHDEPTIEAFNLMGLDYNGVGNHEFDEGITELCEIVHGHGGQVYVDGANLNALLGYARPGEFGGDVSHLNLHKTFCIPHGGGGPGVGPVAVRAHLAPHLPSHALHPDPEKRTGIGPISAAPYGSAGILPISWAYIRLMGAAGLTRATASAVLAANYVAHRLEEHFPVLYRGHGGLVAHECILDVRGLTKDTGVTVDDVAKRLIDYGFHAPTMSFPVAGTLMVEPTESEDLAELERFCDAMVAIKREIDRVGAGEWTPEESPLRGAPHTARALAGEWGHAYSREEAVFPAGIDPDKYWPPVARVDQAYGDRNLVCACPPPEAFAE